MENKNESNNGIQVFTNFAQKVPKGLSDFDYFTLLDHISQSKIDRGLIAAIFCESKIIFKHITGNKPFEQTEQNADDGNINNYN